jgi:hypothetical protein
MSTIPIYPVNYIKPHSHYQENRSRFHAILGCFVKKLFAQVEGITTFAVVMFIAALVFLVFMRLGEVGAITDFYCNTCDLLPTMFVAP